MKRQRMGNNKEAEDREKIRRQWMGNCKETVVSEIIKIQSIEK